MKTKLFVVLYVAAILCANLLVAAFGPWISPINSFLLIGFDLSMRDVLQSRLRRLHMGGLIIIAGILTYLLNPTAGIIAIASSVAFTVSALTDWAVFTKLKGSWLYRSNSSNTAGAAVDSIMFPTIAFGALLPEIVLLQFLAKVSGGAIWSIILNKFRAWT